jgi:putative membrane protein
VPALLAGLYLACAGPLRGRFSGSAPVSRAQMQFFMTGVVLLFVAVVSPIEVLSGYLLSIHMVQHLILTMLVAPLLLVGTPGWMLRPLLRPPLARPLARALTQPVATFLLFNAIFLGWHVPAFYDLALRDPAVHMFEHVLFLAAALLTWWPVFSPLDELPRMADPPLLLYLFFESLPPTILGALITFAGGPLYPSYVAAPRLWGLSVATDQQLGGLIMWVPGALVYFVVLTGVFFRWLNRDEYEQSQDTRRPAH